MSSTLWWPSTWVSPLAADGQVKIPMPGEQLQHVVQEPHAGGDVRLPSAVQV